MMHIVFPVPQVRCSMLPAANMLLIFCMCVLAFTLNGHVRVKDVPRDSSDWTVKFPPNNLASCLHMLKPSPKSVSSRFLLTMANGSKILAKSSGGIPMPVSTTEMDSITVSSPRSSLASSFTIACVLRLGDAADSEDTLRGDVGGEMWPNIEWLLSIE